MESELEQLSQAASAAGIDAGQSVPLPGTEAYEALPQFRRAAPFPFGAPFAARNSADRPLGRNNDLRNGASRRISASPQPDAALRRVGLGRSGSLDRKAQASLSRRHLEAGRPSTKTPPCPGGVGRRMTPDNRAHLTKASSSLDAERDSRRPSFATLTCRATRATSNMALAS